ncbi:MAG: molybdopterin-guanine dinucleotide biosynthesis protein MobB, partial [Candidatus Hydrogenedentes bacterium]|nr:molybdopterin-guanine dinucleotide biosynthesis protein MobB [Candidatus Hydrogenedentota bacterium]
MDIVHIVGRRNHGKTLLITCIVRELASRGLNVATAKHCGHPHELDTPGKDSFHHRKSGAALSAVITPAMCAVYKPRASTGDVYAELRDWAGDAAILLVEGDINGPGRKLEVWREDAGGLPLALERDDISAVITDHHVSL